MARAIDCKTCVHEKVCDLWVQQERQDASCFCLDGCDYFEPTLTPPNEWVSVEERLPEDEARQYIEDDLDGIGYLYPCLLTYKSPNTERIHVVRFYYDIIQRWFVNNGEELCEKSRCIAWMPLPAPYDRRPPEGEDT